MPELSACFNLSCYVSHVITTDTALYSRLYRVKGTSELFLFFFLLYKQLVEFSQDNFFFSPYSSPRRNPQIGQNLLQSDGWKKFKVLTCSPSLTRQISADFSFLVRKKAVTIMRPSGLLFVCAFVNFLWNHKIQVLFHLLPQMWFLPVCLLLLGKK